MSLLFSKSGTVQSVKPSSRTELYTNDGAGGEAKDEDMVRANQDTDAPIKTGVYDGNSAFGIYVCDPSLNGGAEAPVVP